MGWLGLTWRRLAISTPEYRNDGLLAAVIGIIAEPSPLRPSSLRLLVCLSLCISLSLSLSLSLFLSLSRSLCVCVCVCVCGRGLPIVAPANILVCISFARQVRHLSTCQKPLHSVSSVLPNVWLLQCPCFYWFLCYILSPSCGGYSTAYCYVCFLWSIILSYLLTYYLLILKSFSALLFVVCIINDCGFSDIVLYLI